jgi:hypothetical protein
MGFISIPKGLSKKSDNVDMKKCLACKSMGKNRPGEFTESIFIGRGGPTPIPLCYGHSVELFKTGQSIFILKYKSGAEEDEFTPREVRKSEHNYFSFNSFR